MAERVWTAAARRRFSCTPPLPSVATPLNASDPPLTLPPCSQSGDVSFVLLKSFADPCAESQRDSVVKPRVARNELPWVCPARAFQPQRGCSTPIDPTDATPLGLKGNSTSFPRVARSSQPWAGGCNPFGIVRDETRRVPACCWHRSLPIQKIVPLLPYNLFLPIDSWFDRLQGMFDPQQTF